MDVVDLINNIFQYIIMLFIIGQFYFFLCDLWFVCEIGIDWKYLLIKFYLEVFVFCVFYLIESNNLSGEENEQWKLILFWSLLFGVFFLIVREEKRLRSNWLLVGFEDYVIVVVVQFDLMFEKLLVSFYFFQREK